MIGLRGVYALAGLLLLWVAGRAAGTGGGGHRLTRLLFWGLLGLLFLVGELLPAAAVGGLVAVLALLAALGGADPQPQAAEPQAAVTRRRAGADRLGNRLFLPALMIPLVTLLALLLLRPLRLAGRPLLDPGGGTLACLAVGCLAALLVALRLTRSRPAEALDAGGRLLLLMGWAATLPLLLAMLGGVFAAAGVGASLAGLLRALLPLQSRVVAASAYGLGMAGFTMILGNAFAAFPVLTLGIGIPILVGVHHADPAPLGALGMLSGYCGTLLTPLAANFNLVPAALLGLDDRHQVIRAQAPTALGLLFVNLVLLNLLPFR